MRIATRLWICLLLVIVLVLWVGVSTRVRHEQRLVLEVTMRDRRFFALLLQQALFRGPTEKPLDAAREMLEHEGIAEAHISVRLVSLAGDPTLPGPRLLAADSAPLARGEVVVSVSGSELITYVPLEGDIALELVEANAIDSLLTRVGWQSLWTQSLSLAGLAGLVTFLLIRSLVGRPLERLTLLSWQIGAGDFSARTRESTANHEVATLGREMNSMAERLDRARHALEQVNAERVAALEHLRHADRLRTVGQLASSLAHELGTPLNVVSGHARLIEEDAQLSADHHASARTILEQASRMTGIVKDLLGFARRGVKRTEKVNLRGLAERAQRTLEPLAKLQNVHIRVDEAAAEVNVTADPQQLLQVLTNLVTNAMQAMPQGGEMIISMEERDAEPPMGVHAPKGRYACLSVTDQGVGIDSDDLPFLFEPFFTRKTEGEGTGLGLAVVEGIAREHRGWVSVQSERGRGSRFEVFLPVHPAPAPSDAIVRRS